MTKRVRRVGRPRKPKPKGKKLTHSKGALDEVGYGMMVGMASTGVDEATIAHRLNVHPRTVRRNLQANCSPGKGERKMGRPKQQTQQDARASDDEEFTFEQRAEATVALARERNATTGVPVHTSAPTIVRALSN